MGTTTTIGDELAANELLRAPDEDTFVRLLLGSLGSHPPAGSSAAIRCSEWYCARASSSVRSGATRSTRAAEPAIREPPLKTPMYFHRLGEMNRRGPEVLADDPALEGLQPTVVADLVAAGAEIVDVRPVSSFAQAHPARALSIPLRPAFASWLGWLAPDDRPLVVLREAGQDATGILWEALKLGYANIVGEIVGGIEAWQTAGLPTAAIDLVSSTGVYGVRVLDIRQEYAAGHLPGAAHLELGDVAGHAAEYADGRSSSCAVTANER